MENKPKTADEYKELLEQLPEDQAESILKAAGLLALKLHKKAQQDKQRTGQPMTSRTSTEGSMTKGAPTMALTMPGGVRVYPKWTRDENGKLKSLYGQPRTPSNGIQTKPESSKG